MIVGAHMGYHLKQGLVSDLVNSGSAPSPVFLFVELLFWPQQQGQESETYIAVNIGNFRLWIKLWIFKSGKDLLTWFLCSKMERWRSVEDKERGECCELEES